MKFYIPFALLLAYANFAFTQETISIPDVALEEALIDLKIDTNGLNGTILVSDARYVVNLNVSNPINNKDLPNVHSKIKDLTGIEYFENLRRLDCYGNDIKKINLTKNTKLSFLNCSDNKIESLDLSNNPELFFVSCDSNRITSLKLGNKSKLTELYCNSNRLTSLDLQNCSALESIDVSGNKIEKVLVSDMVASSAPEGWYKDSKTTYATASNVQVAEKEEITILAANATIKNKIEEPKGYDENYKQMVVKEFEQKVLNEEYLKIVKEKLLQKHNLAPEKLSDWIQKYSGLAKIN